MRYGRLAAALSGEPLCHLQPAAPLPGSAEAMAEKKRRLDGASQCFGGMMVRPAAFSRNASSTAAMIAEGGQPTTSTSARLRVHKAMMLGHDLAHIGEVEHGQWIARTDIRRGQNHGEPRCHLGGIARDETRKDQRTLRMSVRAIHCPCSTSPM